MDLVNTTPLAAELLLSPQGDVKLGHVMAKATFRWDADGRTTLETEEPLPLFGEDQETDFGLLPGDKVPRTDPAFEVVLLGAAHAPGGREAERVTVELTVGEETRRLTVIGDRRWHDHEGRLHATHPVPFSWMPLTWDRAFGGTADAWLDERTVLPVSDPWNRHGRGFDAAAFAAGLGKMLGAPEGYPRLAYERLLPNIEDPAAPVTSPEDSPLPACWATVPPDIGLRGKAFADLMTKDPQHPPPLLTAIDAGLRRAHPTWVIDLPPPGSLVTLTNLTTEGTTRFPLPPVRVLMDYVAGERRGTRDLRPHALVLLPEERRFTLLYRTAFSMQVAPHDERSARLRLETGWIERTVS